MNDKYNQLNHRFRKFYPVVVDIETTGFNHKIHALLEIAIITLKMDQSGWLKKSNIIHLHIKPFSGSLIDTQSLLLNKINPFQPLRRAIYEKEALNFIFDIVYQEMKFNLCKKSIIVAHNAHFDHSFLMAAIKRCNINNNLFHPFVTFDTATLSGVITGQTVLAKACQTIGLPFNNQKAHSALYDTLKTANLFCTLVNKWKKLGGWPFKK
ncbi:ribonuclease T [Buchnera aphidicola]|uniref:Ribonuclease T n=1 Tax=Buchnera aphidicola (Sarucallis kahawaluokalani) TaxID=1241878 RepID=A0A4D6YJP7_9GAMM|nr:ribonuclease T [Buchnera aphidicola]QCI25938.1 ribonuclease T [Buchnera aphidicola (Sarucallis kahawaluokalani)]